MRSAAVLMGAGLASVGRQPVQGDKAAFRDDGGGGRGRVCPALNTLHTMISIKHHQP